LLWLSGCAKYNPDDLFSEAVIDAASAHWDEALASTEQALRSDASHLPSLVLKGLCQHYVQRPVEAEETLRAAAELAPEDFAAQYFHGWILCEAGDHEGAMAPLRRARGLRPEHPETLALLSRCCLALDLPEGIEYLKALRGDPTYGKGPAVENGIALLHLSQGDMVQARNHLFAAIRRDPKSPVVAQNMAVLYDQYLCDLKEARRYYLVARNNSVKAGDNARAAMLGKQIGRVSRDLRAGRQ
jgi:Tfp pilus assembly protein PilF